MTVAGSRRYTLADAIRAEFERTHPRGLNTLLCDRCRRRLDREDFRETPWHGRAVDCNRCEGGGYALVRKERTYWELEQAREKLRAKSRYIRALQLRLLLTRAPSSSEAVKAFHGPLERAVERKAHMWSAVIAEAVREAESGV